MLNEKERITNVTIMVIFVIGLMIMSSNSNSNYFMTSFITDEMKLRVYTSDDGVVFKQFNEIEYYPEQGNKTVRDPSFLEIGDYYYIVYTVIEWGTGNYIGMCRTSDFKEFEELPFLEVGDFYKVWAPAFYTDNGNNYIIINANLSEEQQDFQSYILTYDAEKHVVGESSQIEGLPKNVIDTQIYKIEDTYYLFYKNEDTKYIELAEASELTGKYDVIGSGDWAGWGNTLEGPALIGLEDGTFRLYLDNYEEHQIYYSDSADIKEGWTEKKRIAPNGIAHPDIKVKF